MYCSTVLEDSILRAFINTAYVVYIILKVLRQLIVRMLLVEHSQLPPVLV